ncbi:MAG: tetratricopeptide repeat protein [Myxococcales bacterium]|nr:tetratricopeptide repeat protein [Myxococcales bacterium]MCB9627973.1 tetratricopeptide repeat protein [Sandaracinaceae bacterium]
MLHDPAPRRPLSPGERWTGLGLSLLLFGLFVADVLSPFEPRKLAFPLLLLFWAPALVVHECGHALAAKLVGWRVTQMVLGVGPELFRFRVGETRVVVRALLAEGYVVPTPRVAGLARAKSALVYAGGPGAELLVAGALALAWGWGPFFVQSDSYPLIACQSAALALTIGAVTNLVPHTLAGAANDGMGILLSPGLGLPHFTYLLAVPASRAVEEALHVGDLPLAAETADRALAAHPDNPHLALLRVRVLSATGETDAAVEALEALRETAPRDPLVEAELLHAAALIALYSQDPELLGRALQAVQAAIHAGGASARFEATRGALLYEQGRMDEAFAALQRAYKGTRDPILEDHCVAYLALVTQALGRSEDHSRFARELSRRGTHAHLQRKLAEASANVGGDPR